jgi:hypothetical protein
MKELRNDALILAALSFAGGVILTIGMTTITAMENEITRLENGPQRTHFVWNDDEESIPRDGATIRIEDTDGDTIYLGTDPEYDDAQYQFTTEDDSVKVYDYARYVGKIKLDGKLLELIEKDNE